jgi:selenocysteine-specific elongation factor
VIATSAVTRLGIDALTAALDALPDASRSTDAPFRLPVDRAFVRRGFGTVTTGTARSGRLADGEEVEILPSGLRARVRGIEVHGETVGETRAGTAHGAQPRGRRARRSPPRRGRRTRAHDPADVDPRRARVAPPGCTRRSRGALRVLLGTSEVMAAVSVLDGDALLPGTRTTCNCDRSIPLVALPGDRFVLRRESPMSTIGGGVVLDPWARRARKRDHDAALAECQALDRGEHWPFLRRAGRCGPVRARRRRSAASTAWCSAIACWSRSASSCSSSRSSPRSPRGTDQPVAPRDPRRDLHRGPLAALTERAFDGLADRLASQELVALEGPLVRQASFSIALDDAQSKALARIREQIRGAGLEGADAAPLLTEAADLVHLLLERKEIERVADQLVHAAVLASLAERVRAFLSSRDRMTPADFKELTGLTRKHAIPLLEWLDRTRITVRLATIDGSRRQRRSYRIFGRGA